MEGPISTDNPVSGRVRGVLLDAMGTLLSVDPPGPLLAREMRERWGLELSEGEATSAFAAEIGYYREHHDDGRDPASLADLRVRAAGVLHAALPARVGAAISPAELLPAMLASLRFRPYPEVPAALGRLRDAGLRLAVVSNWDVSLPEVLDRIGLAAAVDAVVTSAAAGSSKPDPALFGLAAARLDLAAEDLVHVGDQAGLDVVGARAAGIDPILVLRDAEERRSAVRDAERHSAARAPEERRSAPPGVPVVADLLAAAELLS